MPLGQGIGEMWGAVRDRVEVSGHWPTWEITAGSFDSALAYARERFGDPAVLARKDRNRWWPRVTLTVTTDATLAASAPDLEEMAHPVVPVQPTAGEVDRGADSGSGREPLPWSLEAIFAHQEELRVERLRSTEQGSALSR